MQDRTNINKRDSGFTILELSIVLTIIALIATTALAVGASRIEAARYRSTTERMDFVLEAFDLYVQRFGYLPCPADNDLLLTDTNFGNGLGSGDNSAYPGNCTQENYSHSSGSLLTLMGGIPTQQLKISPAITLDGWGRRFTYIVDEKLTFSLAKTATPNGGWEDNAVVGTITISNGTADTTTEAAMILMSHGSNGHGAWSGKGGSRIDKGCSGGDTHENSNTGGLTGCPTMDSEFLQKFGTETFDDILVYRTKWQFETP